jgi:hypothetical protein
MLQLIFLTSHQSFPIFQDYWMGELICALISINYSYMTLVNYFGDHRFIAYSKGYSMGVSNQEHIFIVSFYIYFILFNITLKTRMGMQHVSGSLKESYHLEDLDTGWRVILIWILKK